MRGVPVDYVELAREVAVLRCAFLAGVCFFAVALQAPAAVVSFASAAAVAVWSSR